MEKEGWGKKKLGEVCEIYQPKTISTKDLLTDGKYFVYGANGIIGKYDKYNHEQSELLMTCRGATCGSINISKPQSWINGNAMVIHPCDTEIINFFFLKYFLKGTDLSQIITGAAQPQITRQALIPLFIYLPPLPEQQQIVSELDCLQGIIDKKKEQLQELDNLAQSIFYTMFGDPVENEKGWDVNYLKNLSTLKNGINFNKTYEGSIIHFLSVSDFANKNTLNSIDDFSTLIINEEINSEYYLENGDIVFVRSNGSKKLVGRSVLVYPGENRIVYSGFCIRCRIKSSNINALYLSKLLLTESLRNLLDNLSRGANISNLNQAILGNLKIILPPLSLQQEFADKITAIEQQKARIQQSLQNAETLFNSRMDYYFS